MKPEFITEALNIIRKNGCAIKLSLNVPVNDNYSCVHDILIHESNASVIDQLIHSGFSLSMTAKGLSVDKY